MGVSKLGPKRASGLAERHPVIKCTDAANCLNAEVRRSSGEICLIWGLHVTNLYSCILLVTGVSRGALEFWKLASLTWLLTAFWTTWAIRNPVNY